MAQYVEKELMYQKLHEAGGCDAEKNSYADGWDKAIDEAIRLLDELPTVDVAAKSEVVKALNEVELLIIITKEMYKQQMEDAPNELSKQSKRTKWVAFEKFYEQFAELKKKYTEENK